MRKALYVLPIAAAAAFATPALAQPYENDGYAAAAPWVGGAAVGTVAGVGTYNAWWGSGTFASTLPTSAVGAAAVGGVVGIGTVALIDAAIQPCRGFHALFDLNHGRCVDGQYVGDGPRRVSYREPYRERGRRVYR